MTSTDALFESTLQGARNAARMCEEPRPHPTYSLIHPPTHPPTLVPSLRADAPSALKCKLCTAAAACACDIRAPVFCRASAVARSRVAPTTVLTCWNPPPPRRHKTEALNAMGQLDTMFKKLSVIANTKVGCPSHAFGIHARW
jgi:hypothetical protein